MEARDVSKGLGWFSLALGAAELLAPKQITEKLDAKGHENVVKAFGARELIAGLGILAAPAHAAPVWGRVGGDGLDLAALALAARNSPKNAWVWGAIGFVVGAAVADWLTAQRLSATPDPAMGATGPASSGAAGKAVPVEPALPS